LTWSEEGKTMNEEGNEGAFKPLQIQSLLWEVVSKANDLVNGDGCSIFLREEGTTRYILRDTTTMSPYLGNFFFTVAPDEQPYEKMGATKYVAVTKKSLCVRDLRCFEFWSNYGLKEKELKDKFKGECELPHDIVGPFLAVPLLDDKEEVVGVIRVVRRREDENQTKKNKKEQKNSGKADSKRSKEKGEEEKEEKKKYFCKEDQEKLEKYVRTYLPRISWAIDISRLLEIGSMLNLKALCTQIVQVLTRMLNARGCSIYLFDEMKDGAKIYRCVGTTGLLLVLPEGGYKEVEDIYYEYKEDEDPKHLTTAVIRYGRNIITKNLTEFDPKSVFPAINRKKSKYKNKFWKGDTLMPSGPAIFVPMSSPCREKNEKCDVLGVITISRPKGEKPFSPQEFRLLLSLSKRLSRIIRYSRFMFLLNQPLTTSNPEKLKESFDSLIFQICEVSGAPGATLFIRDGCKLISKCSYGLLKDEEIVYQLPLSPSEYGSPPYVGYTTWVAVLKEVLRFNDPSELQSNRWDVQPIHSNTRMCEVSSTLPHRFLAVPIIGTDGEVRGVLRSAKTRADAPFTPNDEALFSSLAARLSPVIESISTLEHLESMKEERFYKIFAKELRIKLESVFKSDSDRKSFIEERIRDFYRIDPLDERDIGTRTLESIRSLWNGTEILITGASAPLEPFKFFDEQILAELPGYRDHFIHQYQVFLLGYYIIRMLNTLEKPFHEDYCRSLNLDIADEEKEKIADIAWLITSTFHDIAYPLEKIKRWLPKIIVDFLGEEGKGITPEVPVEKIFFQSQTYLNFVNEIAAFFSEMDFFPGIREADFRAWLQGEVASSKDHGVLGSLILMKPGFLSKKEIILPSALAIALHKRLGLKVKSKGGKISYDRFPLFFLLLYCDLVQEWNRDLQNKGGASLKKIIVTRNIDEIVGAKDNVSEEIIQNKDTIYVHSEIIVTRQLQQKKQECEEWLDFAYSSNPYFTMKINDEFVPKRRQH
jgi:hypothetical protein